MIDNYNDLSTSQMQNVDYFLARADSNRLNILHEKYQVLRARNNEDYRDNVLRDLKIGMIPFPSFLKWLSHVELEGNNSLFVFEAEEDDFLDAYNVDSLYDSQIGNLTPLHDINPESIDKIHMIDVVKDIDKNQVIFTIAAPAQTHLKKLEGHIELENHVYLSYVVVDFKINSVVVLMHPTANLVSIHGVSKKREIDELTYVILHYFRENVLEFTLKEPEWIEGALTKISEEYFYHNNPKIKEKVNDFSDKLLPKIIEELKLFDNEIDEEESLLRIAKGFEAIYESEMIVIHERIERKTSFNIFLQQTDRGATSFKANSRGMAMSHAETGDIIRLMWEHGEMLSVGITHMENNKQYSYIIKKLDQYYSLKKHTTSGAEKGVVDNVLRKLNKYKNAAGTINFDADIEEAGDRTEDS